MRSGDFRADDDNNDNDTDRFIPCACARGNEANVILAQWLTVTTILVCCIEFRTAVPTSSQLISLRVALFKAS